MNFGWRSSSLSVVMVLAAFFSALGQTPVPDPSLGDSSSSTPRSPVAWKGPVEWNCTRDGRAETLLTSFYQTTPAMVLLERARQVRPAFQVRSADGAKYDGQDVMFWEAGGEAIVKWSGLTLKCKPR